MPLYSETFNSLPVIALKFEIVDNRMLVFGRGDLHLGVLFERMRR